MLSNTVIVLCQHLVAIQLGRISSRFEKFPFKDIKIDIKINIRGQI